MCDHPGCNVVKPISRIKRKYRRSDFLAVLREDNTLTVYSGCSKDNDAVLIAYGKIEKEHTVSIVYPELMGKGYQLIES